MITSTVPDNWRELQDAVGRLLTECGFTVEIEKKVETVRGTVELDVFAQEEVKGRRYSIVVECKHWSSRIPQNVVHGFRTVITDLGANIGYIVSTKGFQEGAFQARELTNVGLLTWEQLQEKFELSWYESYFSPRIAEHLNPLLTYLEPLPPSWLNKLTEGQKKKYFELKSKYDEFGWLIMTLTPYHRMLSEGQAITSLPLIDRVSENSSLTANVPEALLRQKAYREFFEEAVEFGSEIIAQFRKLRDAVT